MDKVDEILKKSAMKTEVNVPDSLTNVIRNTFKDNSNYQSKYFYFRFSSICVSLILLLFTGITFAVSYLNKTEYREMSMRNEQQNESNIEINEGIKRSINNDYCQELNKDYIEQNNIGIKADSLIMDDFNLYLLFNIKYSGDIENIKYIKLKDINITDEYGNLIYDGNDEIFGSNTVGLGLSIEYKKISDNLFYEALNIKSDKFPQISNLYININSLDIHEETKGYYSSRKTTIKGNWQIEINVDQEILDRKLIQFKMKENTKFELMTALASSTQSVFRFKTNIEGIEISSIELKSNNLNSQAKYFSKENDEIQVIFDNTLYEVKEDIKIIIKTTTEKEFFIELEQVK